MESTLLTLFVILVAAAVAPFLASLVPGRAVPEVVFLTFAGAILGQNGLGLLNGTLPPVQLLSDLGLGFLFLMAGYEIDLRELVGPLGRSATLSWLASLGLGYLFVKLFFSSRFGFDETAWVALAILMTTTGYGTLAPILRDRGLTNTRVGQVVTIYGSLGELLPVLAMALLLSNRSPVRTTVALVLFGLVCLLVLGLSRLMQRGGNAFWRFITTSAEASSHPLLRMVAMVLVLLLLVSELFGLDAVLASFAAGFILRALFPQGNEALERGIETLGNSFFVPLFFVVSGASVSLSAVGANVPMLVGFIASLVLIRGVVVAVSLRLDPKTRDMGWREVFSASAYCTLALPLVVAITTVARNNGVMTQDSASVLVTAAALTVLLVPVVTSLVRVADEANPVGAARELAHGQVHLGEVLHEHHEELREERALFRELRDERRQQGTHLSSADFLALAEEARHEVEEEHEGEGSEPRA